MPTPDELPLIGAAGPVVLVDARSAYLLRDGLRRWAAEHRARGGGAKVNAVLPVLLALESAAEAWAAHLLDPGAMSADGRADMVTAGAGARLEKPLGTDDAAELLGLTARQVRRLAAAGQLGATRFSRTWTFSAAAVAAAVEERRTA
jgi:excisionase family DNA binding protein